MGKWTVGVAALVFADGDVGVEIFEEREGGFVYDEAVAGFPLGDGVIEEFGGGEGNQVPVKSVKY